MPDKILTENIHIKYSEMDFDKKLKPFSLLNYLQDIASASADGLGFGYTFVRSNNLMWVLLKYRMEFEKYPANIFDIKMSTEPRGYNRLFAYRNFEIFANDKSIGKVSSIWALVNMTTKEIAPVEQYIQSPYMPKFQKNETDLSFAKVPALSKIDLSKDFEVRYNDVDVNLHANNGNYIVWAFEPLSLDFKTNHSLKTVDMVFKKEIKYGETVVSQVQFEDETTTIHYLKNRQTNEDLCMIYCKWA